MIIVVDFGSQTTHLINRRIRDLGVESRVVSYKTNIEKLKNLEGIILSGGPSFVNLPDSPTISKKVFALGVPVLGICYGMQLMGKVLGGKVGKGKTKEFGIVQVVLKESGLFKGASGKQPVLMSHGDQVLILPQGFINLGVSRDVPNAAMGNKTKKLYAIQFHPEVIHTVNGLKILNNFIVNICQEKSDFNQSKWLENQVQSIKQQVGKGRAMCGLSGGVDSSTAAVLVYKAIGGQLKCVYVDTGLMRLGETEQIEKDFKKFFKEDLIIIRAEKQFLEALKGVEEPEEKRKIIGKLFIKLFEKESLRQLPPKADRQGKPTRFLVQGTIYPDVIESAGKSKTASKIKSHHNVGGLPEKMNLKLIEPLRDLYKDEVRQLAGKLGLPKNIINRQPFPGPGLAIRIRGEVTQERLERLRQADKILNEEIREPAWQTFAVYVPVKTTGVKGDGRSFEDMIAIRSVTAKDAMTADWTRLPYKLLAKVSSRIVNEVAGINRVVYDITTKPPATMEWE